MSSLSLHNKRRNGSQENSLYFTQKKIKIAEQTRYRHVLQQLRSSPILPQKRNFFYALPGSIVGLLLSYCPEGDAVHLLQTSLVLYNDEEAFRGVTLFRHYDSRQSMRIPLRFRQKIRYLFWSSRKKITKNDLTSSLIFLRLNSKFNHSLVTPITNQRLLPSTVLTLIFDGDEKDENTFTHMLRPGMLPPLLTGLDFGSPTYPHLFEVDVLPSTLKRLSFSSLHSQPLVSSNGQSIFPHSLLFLSISYFSSNLDDVENKKSWLPPCLHTFYIDRGFNQELHTHSFPPSLRHLDLGNDFNQKLGFIDPTTKEGTSFLPPFLGYLRLGYFNQSLHPTFLPLFLKCLSFGATFNQPLVPGVFPDSLLSLNFGFAFNQQLDIGVLPKHLVQLRFGTKFNRPFLKRSILPSSLQKLHFGGNFNHRCCFYPKSLTHLSFGEHFNKPLVISISYTSLITLSFGNDFNQPLWKKGESNFIYYLPFTLLVLILGNSFDQALCDSDGNCCLPPSLDTLSIGNNFNQPLFLPLSLTKLTLGKQFNQSFHNCVVPSSLTCVQLHQDYILQEEISSISLLESIVEYKEN